MQKSLTISHIFFLLLVSETTIYSQYGVRVKYNQASNTDWSSAVNRKFATDQDVFRSGYELGLDYWFRLKNQRIEFLPEVAAAISKTTYNNSTLDQLTNQSIGINFHTQIYALDLKGDCNCPTFSKQGPSINKGFFFHLTPGIEMRQVALDLSPLSSFALSSNKTNHVVGKVGIGLGLDLGVSDFFTLTPMISYYFYTKANLDGITYTDQEKQIPYINSEGNTTNIQFSVRLGFRNDYKKGGRRR